MGSYEYTLNKYKGKEEVVVVPEDVTKIGYRAFANNLKLTEVRMPDGVDQIGENAFTSCVKLERVELPPSVSKIGAGAFSGCR